MADHVLTVLPGGSALSDFRAAALLARLRRVAPQVTSVAARHLHVVATDQEPGTEELADLRAILTYGDPWPGEEDDEDRGDEAGAEGGHTARVVVSPRLGTISPWSSKATDILLNCGLDVQRVERVTELRLEVGGGPLDEATWSACADLLHDRMTESALPGRDALTLLFADRSPSRWSGWTSSGADEARWRRPTRATGWRSRRTRSTTSSRPSPRCAVTRPMSS